MNRFENNMERSKLIKKHVKIRQVIKNALSTTKDLGCRTPSIAFKNTLMIVFLVFGLLHSEVCMASYANLTIGTMANTVIQSFTNIAKLLSACTYIAGLGFSFASIMKFKQHKDNPTQVPIGAPLALFFISSALLFFPTILGATGQTLFAGTQKIAGPLGMVF